MADSTLSAFIGWIDFSEEDQKKARDYLRSLSEGTLDELGFGIIRDFLADKFFPATSTIMTRARYFTLVPSIYLHVLGKGSVGETAKKKCGQLEKSLRATLIRNGAIENWRKEEVKRYPASIYWAGIRRLKICNPAIGAQTGYFNSLESYRQNHEGMGDDDKNMHQSGGGFEIWDPEISHLFNSKLIPTPNADGSFGEAIDLKLSRPESNYLKKRFQVSEQDSVIANAFSNESFEPASYPWDWDFPESLATEISFAKHFSRLSKISTLVYYRVLNSMRVQSGREEVEIDLDESIELWWQTTRDALANWDIEEFNNWIIENRICRGSDLNFFKSMHRYLRKAKSASEFVDSEGLDDLIVYREKDKRPNKRRLIPGRFQNEWKIPTQNQGYFTDLEHVPYHLNFRSGIASTIIGDIFEGLNS